MSNKLSEDCPVCGIHWEFIHEHRDEWFLAHRCPVAKQYVFWNYRYTFYLPHGDIVQNPSPRDKNN